MMIIRIFQVIAYILFCTLQRVAPWKYYRLNASFFNAQKGIFSKLDTDQLIPDQWRLQQFLDTGDTQPSHYPVFVKPEWGQNALGVQRADNIEQLTAIRAHRKANGANYLVQHAAPGIREFEIFIIPSIQNAEPPAVISVTETINNSSDPYPINGIYNRNTHYVDITPSITGKQMTQLWHHIIQIGHFRLSRIGVRASSIDAMINGKFHIIEINLLYPMPLTLLASNQSWREKHRFIIRAMWYLAAITKTIPPTQPRKSIFLNKLKFAHQLKLTHKMRRQNERA